MVEKTQIDELVLLKGVPIAIGDNLPIYIHNPLLDDIMKIGEQKYYSIVNMLTSTPSSMKVILNDDMKIDYTTITDFELFFIMFETFKTLDLSGIISGFKFSDMVWDDVDGKPVLRHKKQQWVIDENIYETMMDTLREVHHLKKIVDNPGNEHAKKYLIDRDRRRMRRAKREKYKPYLAFYVKKLVNCQHFKYDFHNVWNLNIYAFLESIQQIDKLQNYMFTMQGAYSGMIEIKQSSLEKAHWLNRD